MGGGIDKHRLEELPALEEVVICGATFKNIDGVFVCSEYSTELD